MKKNKLKKIYRWNNICEQTYTAPIVELRWQVIARSNLKPRAYEDIVLPPVADQASESRIHTRNRLFKTIQVSNLDIFKQ